MRRDRLAHLSTPGRSPVYVPPSVLSRAAAAREIAHAAVKTPHPCRHPAAS